MNPSTQKAVPGIQAGRQRETNIKGDKGKQMNPSIYRDGRQMKGNQGRQLNPSAWRAVSRLGDNRSQMKGDKGRKVNLSTKKQCQASRLGDNGRQIKGNKGVPDILGDKGRQMNPSTQRARHPGWQTTGEGDK